MPTRRHGGFTYTPTTGYTGSDSFTYTANDGTVASNVASVSLTIVNHAPVATNDSYSGPWDDVIDSFCSRCTAV